MKTGSVIAIDGPVASGKGTIAPLLAEKLNAFYLDTGIFYRSLGLYCLEHHLDISNDRLVIQALSNIKIELHDKKILLNGKDITTEIRTVEVSHASSQVAAIPEVRHEVVKRTRTLAQTQIESGSIVIIEGRDSATAVFPDADVKIFLTAEIAIRAQRRLKQFLAKGQKHISLAEVAKDIKERDNRDMNRDTFPLVKNPEQYGYEVVDNSDMSEEETLKTLNEIVKEKGIR